MEPERIQEWVFGMLQEPDIALLRRSQDELEQLDEYLQARFVLNNSPKYWLCVYQDLADVVADLAILRWRFARAHEVFGIGPAASLEPIWQEWRTAWPTLIDATPAPKEIVGKALATIVACALVAFELDMVFPES